MVHTISIFTFYGPFYYIFEKIVLFICEYMSWENLFRVCLMDQV